VTRTRLEGIAFLTIIIVAITSTFVARAEQERDAVDESAEDEAERRIEDKLEQIERRLDQLESLLRARVDT
jgi:F0F1-type ATP synthase membrane subunit b/b'